MKKLILTLLSVLLLALPAQAAQTVHRHLEPETLAYNALSGAAQTQFDTNERMIAIKFRSGITLSSVTFYRSDVNGTAFITQPSVDLRAYLGFKLTFADDGIGWAKDAGTEETLGADLLAGWDFTGGWSVLNATVLSANSFSASNAGGPYKAYTAAYINALLKGTLSLNTTSTSVKLTNGFTAITYATNSAAGYATAEASSASVWCYAANAGDTTNIVMTLKKVLTPSATGVTIVNTQGGTTYNWATVGSTPNTTTQDITITRD